MPDSDVTVSAVFKSELEETTYNVAVQTAENGTVEVDKTTAAEGETVTLTASPDEGYVISSISVADSEGNEVTVTEQSDGTYTFEMPASDVTASAVFEKEITEYSITVSNDDHCTADVVSSAAEGETVTITLTPDTGYNYAWLYIQTVTGYDNEGTAVEFGVLDEVLLDSSSGWTYTFTMPANELIIYVFDGQYTVTTSTEKTEAGGVTLPTPIAEEGENYFFMAYVYDGYTLSDVSVVDANNNEIEITLDETYESSDNSVTSYQYTFTMPASDVTISAVFEEIPTYSVTLSSTITNGTASVDKTSAAEGETVTVTITPDAGYEAYLSVISATTFLPYTYTDNGDGTYSFVMPADYVNVIVGIGKYYVSTANWNGNYGIIFWSCGYWDNESMSYVSKSGIYDEGDVISVSVYIYPEYASTYELTEFLVTDASGNSVEATLVNTGTVTWSDGEGISYDYEFTMPASDVTITTTLGKTGTTGDYTIKVVNEGCSYDVVSSANEGDEVTLKITPLSAAQTVELTYKEIGYDETYDYEYVVQREEVTYTGESSYTYTFTMPGNDVEFLIIAGEYDVTCITEGYGTAFAGLDLVNEGDTVYIYAWVYGGCSLLDISVVDANNNEISYNYVNTTPVYHYNADGELYQTHDQELYVFTMPASDVTVTVTFSEAPYTITIDSNIEGGTIVTYQTACATGRYGFD